MSKHVYSDAPEAIVHDEPEGVHAKNPATLESRAAGTPTRRLGDMKAYSFWLLLGLICVVVIGVTVGGAVGGSIAAGKSHHTETVAQSLSPSGTKTQSVSGTALNTPTSTAPAPSFTPTSDCVGSNGTIYSSVFLSGKDGSVPPSAGLTFRKVCGVEQYGFNLIYAYVPTFEACIELCASLNFWNQNKNCLGVAYNATSPLPGNCWAHNETTYK